MLNLSTIGYFKYLDFAIFNINYIFNTEFKSLNLLLPLGISFFTFQQISFLYESYKGNIKDVVFTKYALFVSFFPQLIAGPIVRFDEIYHQFKNLGDNTKSRVDVGLGIFALGIFKKVVIADSCGYIADFGYGLRAYNLFTGWMTSLSYSMQLYFDFSGYSDMAFGLSLCFGITLPWNFNSPYRSTNIQDFWRRWHISLGRFLRDDLYVPLGGNRYGLRITLRNLFITFVIGGVWHGAGWTFIIWGALHGLALCIHRLFSIYKIKLNKYVSWFITFQFVNFAWIFFRAESIDKVGQILKGMMGLNKIGGPAWFKNLNTTSLAFVTEYLGLRNFSEASLIFVFAVCISFFMPKNTLDLLAHRKQLKIYESLVLSFIMAYAILNITRAFKFLYFDF